jgi:hypothetical protein
LWLFKGTFEMQTLSARHADRAQRKADNEAYSVVGESGGNFGLAMVRLAEAQTAIGNLSGEQRDELAAMMQKNGIDGFVDETNLYDSNGNLKHAGVGVVNPLIVPPAAQTGDNIGGGVADNGWGDLPTPNTGPEQGSADGVALEAQTGSGNAETAPAPVTGRGSRAKTAPEA